MVILKLSRLPLNSQESYEYFRELEHLVLKLKFNMILNKIIYCDREPNQKLKFYLSGYFLTKSQDVESYQHLLFM
jgi:hypothetical protein